MATQKRNLKGNRNNDGDFEIEALDAVMEAMSPQAIVDAGGIISEPRVYMDELPRYMDDPDPTLEADIEDLKVRIEARGLDTPEQREFLETVKEEVKDAVETSKETGVDLPENIQKVIDFMDETGGDLNDYVKLNQDYNKFDDKTLLREYYNQTKLCLA